MSDINPNPELSMPLNDIQARREARRRKILENAKDRLEKLNGRIASGSDDTQENGHTEQTTHRTFSDPEIETEELFGPRFPIIPNSNTPRTFDANSFGGNFSISNASGTFNANSFGGNIGAGAEAELENIFQLFSQMNQFPTGSSQQNPTALFTPIGEQNIEAQPESKLVRFFKTKVHLFLISSITYVLFASGQEYFTKYSVFLPLLIWELTETFLFRTKENNNANVLFRIAFMMGGISPNITNGMLKIIGTLNKIFKDVGIFIFFFVFCHILFTIPSNNYSNL